MSHPIPSKRRLAVVLGALAMVVASTGALPVAAAIESRSSQRMAMAASTAPVTNRQLVLRTSLDRLWEDHITWTRLYIISALDGAPDLQPTTERLLQNQVDIGNAIKPFYGDAAGEQLTSLLKEHILIAADVVSAAKAGDTDTLNAGMARWQANADQIAEFLSAANPDNWSAADLKAMMRQHLDLTTAEVVARLKGDWSGDVAAYDKVHDHILMLSQALSDGLVAQFPSRFADA